MSIPLHERPSIPLTWAEQDRFADLAVLASTPAPRITRYDTRRTARLRAVATRVRRSRFADDLRAAWRAAFWPAVICSGFIVGLALLWATRGSYADWTGFHPIPTEAGTR